MKEQGRIVRSCLLMLGILLSFQYAQAVPVIWSGISTPDVTDNNLVLDASGGIITLQGQDDCNATSINATTTDVTVTIVNGNATIQGNTNGQTILNLNPAAGRTITFDLTGVDSLTFWGAIDVALSRLLILQEGPGTVQFLLRGGNSLTFTNNPTLNGPVEFYLYLQNTLPLTQLSFIRTDLGVPANQADTALITIGGNSLLSYASSDGLVNASGGRILFDPTNVGLGRMVLQVNDTGAFTMAVQQAVFADGTFCSVNRNIPAGGLAQTLITNSDGTGASDAALMINNYNATYAEYLIDPYGDLGAATDLVNYRGLFNGFRYGVSAGANHQLNIQDNAYLDYVGLANNICPTPLSLPGIINPDLPPELCPCTGGVESYLKLRNYSALTIDGWFNPNSIPSEIVLGVQSGIYFRSGISGDGNIVNNDLDDPNVFTINPCSLTAGAGEYVFDVEAELQVIGSNLGLTLNSRLEILSLEVVPHAGPLFPVEGTGNLFLARNFAVDGSDNFYTYNKGAWLINDRAVFTETAIAHTDVLHNVCQNNDVTSEPTYVGGEKWWLSFLRQDNPLVPRPVIDFQSSLFQIQTSVGITGVDLSVPTYLDGTALIYNDSEFRFYSNGYIVDNGTGRSFILGTLIGSQACDNCTVISDDAHLNIIQDSDYISIEALPPFQDLFLTTAQNNAAVNNAITTNITGQTSVHAIYLGHNSNISIGTNAATIGFNNITANELIISGDFFNFGTRGGSVGIPATSSVTGQGGIFVDLNGVFKILPRFIASIDVMITKSQDGIVDLPVSQVFFSDQIGITDWQLNLVVNPVIVPTGSEYSDYTLNWLAVIKDPDFVPYIIQDVTICHCPPVLAENIIGIPAIQGEVNQLQIVNSRIGDPAQIIIAGGWVRELLWLSDCRAGEAPVAVVALQDHGRLGLNNAHRNPDSLLTQTTLGVNGINIIANGSCRIDLNDDMIVNNICAFLQGPRFSSGDVLEIRSEDPYTLYVTKEGVLDFSSFFTFGAKIRFGGNIRVLFEPGATLVLGSTPVEFGDQAVFEVDSAYELGLRITASDALVGPIDNTVNPLVSALASDPNNQYSPLLFYGSVNIADSNLHVTDPYRVRVLGTGTLRFTDNATANIRTNGILSVETLYQVVDDNLTCEVPTTDVTLELLEAAQFNIGKGNNILGGVLQIGDLQFFEEPVHSINFTLTINGPDAVFGLGSGAFLGFGAGVARPNQGVNDNQSNVLADTLFNVDTVTLNLLTGNFKADRVFASDDVRSQSIVFGLVDTFHINFINGDTIEQQNTADFLLSGGGNIFYMVPGQTSPNFDFGVMRLISNAHDNTIIAPWPSIPQPGRTVVLRRLFDGLLASSEMIADFINYTVPSIGSFGTLKLTEAVSAAGRSTGLAVAAPVDTERFRNARTLGRFAYIDRGMIGRQDFADLLDEQGASPADRREDAYGIGAARIEVNTAAAAPGEVLIASNILS